MTVYTLGQTLTRTTKPSSRVIISYGPPRYGGMQIRMDLKTEQIAKHVSNLITHVRRDDRDGKTTIASINTYQLLIGQAQHFMKLNAFTHEYQPPKSESVITYIWEGITNMGYTIEGPSLWVYPEKYDRDTAIMDDVITERER